MSDSILKTPIDKEAEAFADSIDIRGCSYWYGLYTGFKAGKHAMIAQDFTPDQKSLFLTNVELSQRIMKVEKENEAYKAAIKIIHATVQQL